MYLSIFFILLVLCCFAFIGEKTIVKSAYRLRLFDKPNERKIHTTKIPRLGGLIIFPTILVGLLLLKLLAPAFFKHIFISNELLIYGLLASLAVVFICGLVDDIVGIRYRNKFVAQILAGIALCSCGIVIDDLHGLFLIGRLHPAAAWLLTIFTVIFVTNAINFIDGIDGLAGNLTIMALICYGIIFVMTETTIMILLCIFVAISLIALLIHNMLGRADRHTKVFMGDGGSLTLGVFLCMCAITVNHVAVHDEYVSINPSIYAIAPLLLPCFDVVRVVLYRYIHGKNVFKADKSHIHHKFLELGFTQFQTLLIILAINAVMLTVAFTMAPHVGCNIVVLVEGLLFIFVFYLIMMKQKANRRG